jgi:hypothetical protein
LDQISAAELPAKHETWKPVHAGLTKTDELFRREAKARKAPQPAWNGWPCNADDSRSADRPLG